jgi:transcriptional regulator with XRE-family HTH domain
MVDHVSVRRALARAIRQQRTLSGMTRRQLAARMRVSAASIGRLERGEADISAEAFVRLARVLKVDPVKLLRKIVKDS